MKAKQNINNKDLITNKTQSSKVKLQTPEAVKLGVKKGKAEPGKAEKGKVKSGKLKEAKVNLRDRLKEKLKHRKRRRPPVIPDDIKAALQRKPRKKRSLVNEITPLPAEEISTNVIVAKKSTSGKPSASTIIISDDSAGIKPGKVKYKVQLNTEHKPASIGWKYFPDNHGYPLMKIYTENPGVYFKLEKLGDIKKSARYYTQNGNMIGADFIIPYPLIETACTIAGVKIPKNLAVISQVEQQAV